MIRLRTSAGGILALLNSAEDFSGENKLFFWISVVAQDIFFGTHRSSVEPTYIGVDLAEGMVSFT
jgi:hypothetical protein